MSIDSGHQSSDLVHELHQLSIDRFPNVNFNGPMLGVCIRAISICAVAVVAAVAAVGLALENVSVGALGLHIDRAGGDGHKGKGDKVLHWCEIAGIFSWLF